MEQEVIANSLLKRNSKLKLPDVLPWTVNSANMRNLLSVIEDIRDRALFLPLLQTRIRIGEALGLRLDVIYRQASIDALARYAKSPAYQPGFVPPPTTMILMQSGVALWRILVPLGSFAHVAYGSIPLSASGL